MLQEPRDGIDVGEYRRIIEEVEEKSRRIARDLVEVFRGLDYAIIAYHRQGYLPASIHYWMKAVLDRWSRTHLVEAATLAYYLVAYSEPTNIVYYTSNPRSSSTLHLLQSSSLTGHRIYIYTVKLGDERLLDILEQYNPYYIDSRDELEASLIYAMSVYHALAGEYREAMGRRGERLYRHSVEGFAVIVEELLSKYMGVLRELTGLGEVRVTSSHMYEPVSLYFVEALRRRGVRAYYEPIEYVAGPGNILLLSTSVEEYLLKEKRFRLGMTGAHIYEINMNTDPLEALIYFPLLAYYLSRGSNIRF